jgi:N-acetylneuraminic acid mutarotase
MASRCPGRAPNRAPIASSSAGRIFCVDRPESYALLADTMIYSRFARTRLQIGVYVPKPPRVGGYLRNALLVTQLLVLPAQSAATQPQVRPVTFEQRVAAQRAIEQVYWNHRIWPSANPQQKPEFASTVTDELLTRRVEDYLAKSNALELLWKRPITAEQLQAEMNRMARDSQDPGVLRELFSVLGDDPSLIAETLARQTLADRLIRNWYAADQHFTSDVRATAEAARAACSSIDCMTSMGGEYGESIRRLQSSGQEGIRTLDPDDAIDLNDSAWRDYRDRLAEIVGGKSDRLSAGRLSRVLESEDEFFVTAVLSQTDRTVSAAHVRWPKRTFESWWESQRPAVGRDVPSAPADFSLPSVSAAPCFDDTWTPTRIEVPDARSAHTAVWTGAEMIVWGGDSGSGRYNSGGRYNPSTDNWTFTSMGAGVPSARRYHSAVWTGTEMIVWGGEQEQSPVWVNTGARYNPTTDSWTPTSTSTGVPVRRSDHTAVWTGSEMIVWGGSDSVTYQDTGGRYNPATDTWTATSMGANHPSPRRYHTATWTGTEMVVWGGANPAYLNTGGRYDPSTDTWTATSIDASTPSARMRHSSVWSGTELIVWGGNNGADLNSGGRYEPSSNSWKTVSAGPNLPTARSLHTAVWTGSEMIVWGASSAGPTGGRYDPVGNTWQPTSTAGSVPSVRMYHTAVWTGSEMIIWGGGFGARVSTGGRYSPTTDSWVPTRAAVTVPSERYLSSVVWTGSEAIVWGGADDLGTKKTGSRYVPATDVWVPTAIPATVPTSRYWQSAVWTGTEMIVWGGVTSANQSNVGGRYNPSTDSWTPTSTAANNPSGRSLHTAIWTGTEMIVWGGSFQGGIFNTGGRYNPASNSWVPTSLGANLPSLRCRHTAVWTGNEMIIWGGEGGSALNTGGRYDPAADTWTATSTGAGVPVRRTEHTAVWTGSEMIVWGGYNLGGGIQPTAGGRYAPATNSWTAVSTVNAPPIRNGPTGVWTGKHMIVWGGFSSTGGFSQPNGRYNPANDTWLATSTANAPSYRQWHVGTWTGTAMFIWGGEPLTMTGGLYCACPLWQVSYRDADGDGFGDPGLPQPSCDGVVSPGYVSNDSDCDDANASVHPGVFEVCNGVDDNCNGQLDDVSPSDIDKDGQCDICDLDDGIIYIYASDKNLREWQPEAGYATWNSYRGSLAVLAATGQYTQQPGSNPLAARACGLSEAHVVDGAVSPGEAAFTLVSGVVAGVEGNLGVNSLGIMRANQNPCP